MISLFENPTFLQVNTAITSAPSMTPPPRITKPTPAPMRIPPNIAISNLSGVTGSMRPTTNPMAKIISAIVVYTANVFPIFLYPR